MSEELAKEIMEAVSLPARGCALVCHCRVPDDWRCPYCFVKAALRQEFNRGVEACAEEAAKCLTDDGKILAGKLLKLKKKED